MNDQPTTSFSFSCSSMNPSVIARAFSSIYWKTGSDQFATMTISATGICAITDDAVTQASLLLRSSIFSSFMFLNSDAINLKIPLSCLVNCLKLYSDKADRVEIRINDYYDLEISIFNGKSETKSIVHSRQLTSNEINDSFANEQSPVSASFRIDSPIARDFFLFPNEPRNNSTSLSISIDPQNRVLILTAEGAYGNCQSRLALTGANIQNLHLNLTNMVKISYSVTAIQPMLKALESNYTNQTKFLFKENGKLAVQHAIRVDDLDNTETFVDFVIPPSETE